MDLGDRMKLYESYTTQHRLLPLTPFIVRIDGRCFSRFTKEFDKPFDTQLLKCMDYTTIELIKESGANIGYTQSDEITLVFLNDDIQKTPYFGGKVYKITSILSAYASVVFNECMSSVIDIDKLINSRPVFDARVWSVPSKIEAYNTLLWRELDSIKNSKQQLARHYFSHSKCHGKNEKELISMLEDIGVIWGNLPCRFKRGRFFKKQDREIKQLDNLPINISNLEDPIKVLF